jgi:hypothetical protein
MSQSADDLGLVGQTIKDLLPTVNEGFNWDIIENRYDEDPVGTAMSLHFTDGSGEEALEDIYLGIAQGPQIVILPGVDENWDYIGAVVTYQDFGMRILDPDDEMTPDRARYQHGGVTINSPEEKSRERTWMVISNVLDIMLESLIYNREAAEQGGGA